MAKFDIQAVIKAKDEASQTINGVLSSVKSFQAGAQIALTAAAVGFGVLGKSVIDTGGQFESFRTSFTGMLGSAGQAQTMLDQISKFAKETPFELPQVVEGAKRLMAYNVEARDIIPTFQMLGDISASVGADKLPQLIMAFGQVKAATKLTGMELRQFSETGIPLLSTLADGFGVTASEMTDMISKGKVSFGDVQKALLSMTQDGGRFFGGMERQSRTFNGAVSNLKDSFTILKAKIGETLTSSLAPYVTQLANFIVAHQQTIVAVAAGVGAVVMFATAVLAVSKALAIARIAAVAFQMSSLPLMLILGTIAALIGVVVYRAVKGFQEQMASSAIAGEELGSTLKTDVTDGLNKTSKASQDLTEKLADIDDQMRKSTQDFRYQMAEAVASIRQRVADIKGSLAEETSSFEEAQAERAASFKEKQDEMTATHAEKVADIQKQIDEELAWGQWADQEKLADLRTRLEKENADYDRQFSKLTADYEKDTGKAKEEHDKKMLDLETRLAKENETLEKHKNDVLAIKDVQLLDELEKLKVNHAEQMAEYEKQKQKAIKSAGDSAAGMNAEYVKGAQALASDPSIKAVGGTMGVDMAGAFKTAIMNSIKDIPRDMMNYIKGGIDTVSSTWNEVGGMSADAKKNLAGDLNWFQKALLAPQLGFGALFGGKAVGGSVYAGQAYTVGEQGAETFIPSVSGTIVPNGGGGGVTVNFYGNIQNTDDRSLDEISTRIARQITLAQNAAY